MNPSPARAGVRLAEGTGTVAAVAPGLVDARLVARMRQAQRAYFKARKEQPHVIPLAQLNHARELEAQVDALVADALARERVELPGFGAEGGAPR